MNLSEWLKQGHTLSEQLRLVEGLCEALMEAHRRGVHHRAIKPANVDVKTDGALRITENAVRGEPGKPHSASSKEAAAYYAAPEVQEKGQNSIKSDIFSVGVICYEVLAGRHPFVVETAIGTFETILTVKPAALGDVRPEISRDLSDAIMICLDSDPEWRPKDLSYVLKLTRGLRPPDSGRGGKGKEGRSAAPSPKFQRPSGGGSRLPIVLGGVLAVGAAAAGAWWYLNRPAPTPPPPTASPTPAPVMTPTAPPSLPVSPPTTPTPGPTPRPTVTPQPVATATPTPAVRLTPTPAPVVTPRPSTGPSTRPSGPDVRVTPTPEPIPTATPTPAPITTQAPPSAPAVLRAISPPSLKRGGNRLVDVRGQALRSELQAEVTMKGAPAAGLRVSRSRFVSDSLFQVLIVVDAEAAPGVYELAMADAGGRTNRVTFQVER